MKVLIVYSSVRCSCTRKNTFEMEKAIRLVGHECDKVMVNFITEQHFKDYDVIMFQRIGANGYVVKGDLMDRISFLCHKYRGKTLIVYNIDDLLTNNIVKRFVKIADTLIVPNEVYNEFFEEHNKHIRYYHTFVDTEAIDEIKNDLPLPHDKFKILWGSTALLGNNLMEYLVPRIEEEFRDCKVYIIGNPNTFYKRFSCTEIIPIVTFEFYIKFIKKCDIMLNPISIDHPYVHGTKTQKFIQAKSPIKYLNAGYCKTPIISSHSDPYEAVIKDEWNGLLVKKSSILWIDAIKRLREDYKLREDIIENAYNDVSQNFNLHKIGTHMIKLFQEEIDGYENRMDNDSE